MACFIVLSSLPLWATKRLAAWETLRSSGEVGITSSLVLAAAGAPARLAPWYYNWTDYSAFVHRGQPFGVWQTGDPAKAQFIHIPPIEPGVVIALKVMRRVLHAPLSLVTLTGIQLGVDAVVLALIGWIAFQFGGTPAVLLAAGLHAGWGEISAACVYPFYYYWPIPFSAAFFAIALRLSGGGRRAAAVAWAAALGVTAGSWCWFRGTAVSILILTPLAAYLLARERAWRRPAAVAALVGLVVVLAPAAIHNLPRSGSLFPRAQVWHDLYAGLGTRPNPYGIRWDDSFVWGVAVKRHGVEFQGPGYEEALRSEYLEILRTNPGLIARNFVLNFFDSVRGWSFWMPHGFQKWLWLLALAGVVFSWATRSPMAMPMTIVTAVWWVQCLTLSLVGRPQSGYLWETLGSMILSGSASAGFMILLVFESVRRLRSRQHSVTGAQGS
ncbi:MAG: hypothetical protein ACRD1B_11010 [Thermoanaerobaculia bacterium]